VVERSAGSMAAPQDQPAVPGRPSTFNQKWLSSLNVGAFSGCLGIVGGSVVGLLRSKHPAVFAVTAGIQWFGLGSVYWLSKCTLMDRWENDSAKLAKASTVAGALSGASVSALTSRPSRILPATVFFGGLGYIGQNTYNSLDASHTASVEAAAVKVGPDENFLQRMAKKKWSPMKELKDDEYEAMIREKILRVDAEIALIDEDLEQLRAASSTSSEQSNSNES